MIHDKACQPAPPLVPKINFAHEQLEIFKRDYLAQRNKTDEKATHRDIKSMIEGPQAAVTMRPLPGSMGFLPPPSTKPPSLAKGADAAAAPAHTKK